MLVVVLLVMHVLLLMDDRPKRSKASGGVLVEFVSK